MGIFFLAFDLLHFPNLAQANMNTALHSDLSSKCPALTGIKKWLY